MQLEIRMRHIVICGMPGSVVFSALSKKMTQFSKKKESIDKRCCLFSLQVLSETFLILRRNERDKNICWSSCKVPVILVWFYYPWIFGIKIRKRLNPVYITVLLLYVYCNRYHFEVLRLCATLSQSEWSPYKEGFTRPHCAHCSAMEIVIECWINIFKYQSLTLRSSSVPVLFRNNHGKTFTTEAE
jgi:hypothetical protein